MRIDLRKMAFYEAKAFHEETNIVLECKHRQGEEKQLHSVSEAHGLEPDSESASMRADIVEEIALVIESESFLFKVILVRCAVKCQHVIRGGVLKN